jgi:1L-myo-inositol 1-phosphate cytidylyltransferase
MDAPNIDLVVVIAAGLGSRLKSEEGPPKPLLPVAGRPLALRVLDRFAQAGATQAVVVIGHRGDEVRAGIESGRPALSVSFATNERWKLSNGLSVLAARGLVGERRFFLSMSDHIFDASLIAGLKTAPVPEGGLTLAVDRKLCEIYDMDDATKVRTAGGRIAAIAKDLVEFDAVDTGLFACTSGLFVALERAASSRADGDCALSDGVRALAAQGLAAVHDVGAGRWQDVDTPGAVTRAEKVFG